MNMHFTDWTTSKPYLRRGHVLSVARQMLLLYQVAAAYRRQARELRRLADATPDLPDYLKRDIGLLR